MTAPVTLRFNQAIDVTTVKPCTAVDTPAGCNLTINRGSAFDAGALHRLAPAAYDNATFTLTLDAEDTATAPDLRTSQAYFVRLRGGEAGPATRMEVI